MLLLSPRSWPEKQTPNNGATRAQAEQNGLICSGPRRGKQFTYALLDEYGIGYKDRSAITSDAVSARLGNLGNALTYLLVLDGQVIGSCRRTLQKDTVTIELSSFQPLTIDEQQAITEAAQRFSLFLQLGVELVWE